MKKTLVYIDGYNLYYGLCECGNVKVWKYATVDIWK